ncbi:DNA-binding transcriptional activator PunR [Psychromonas sp. Urea-02u-13]|uniref:DNA-binding transcriptional activator PunR n=1 Tax=Psychromonas sp. Urea-02u-13 TaxID=2058326 RepID=UPI000C33F867|nr:DNA-binding transcriptional activator PunR [Psychromonas sp. Urea-02u-13]PKG39644.1 LysR family transcriptional regulator [Psychromonas sp. Urea-02u-13]
MFSNHDLVVIDAVARRGSFTAAADELHKVPSAISYTVKVIEDKLGVFLFKRLHRKVQLTPAGEYFVTQARSLLKQMGEIKQQTQRVANGWQSSVSIALDNVVHESSVNQLVADFYQAFPDIELLLTMEVFNGVWDALADGRADIAIGATSAVPITGGVAYRSMGELCWDFVVSKDHPLAQQIEPITDQQLIDFPCICLEDSARKLPKRATWLVDNQRRLVVPNWHSAEQCFIAGLGIGVMPAHRAIPLIEQGLLIKKELLNKAANSPCCLAWKDEQLPPAVKWLLNYLGDSEKLHQQWLA